MRTQIYQNPNKLNFSHIVIEKWNTTLCKTIW